MKKFIGALVALYSAFAFSATLSPVQLLNPAGSTSGQAIISTGASSAPAWGNISATALGPVAANTVIANATASSASPIAFSMPSCSTGNSALHWASGTGFTCATNVALTTSTLGQFASTTSAGLASVISDETGTGSLVFGTSPTISGATLSNPTASGTLTGFPGRLLNVQVFSSSGTYTPTSGTTSIIVKVQAPGGGSGGVASTTSSQVAASGGGNGGSYAEVRYTSITTQTVTIGAAGTAGTAGANAGGTGGTTSFGSLVSCPGGNGGGGGSALSAAGVSGASPSPNAACTISGGTTLNSVIGGRGQPGMALTSTIPFGGAGGNSYMGIGYVTSGSAQTGYGFGAGAGAYLLGISGSASAGAPGAAGVIEVFEYQ